MTALFLSLVLTDALATGTTRDCDTNEAPEDYENEECLEVSGGGALMCRQEGLNDEEWTCYPGSPGTGTEPVIYVVTDYDGSGYDNGVDFSAYGTAGDGTKFCCAFEDDDDEITHVIVRGSEGDESKIAFYDAGAYLTNHRNSVDLRGQIFGLGGDDWIDGSASSSSDYYEDLYGGDGADQIYSKGADTSIWGGAGDDILEGSGGDDIIHGEDGDDAIKGGAGTDTIKGGLGDDLIRGDTLTTSSDADWLYGGPGNDSIYGFGGDDHIWGDRAEGSSGGNDTIRGMDGDDTIYGDSPSGVGIDKISGGPGDDTISGLNGDDIICGDDDVDVILGGPGDDLLWGGWDGAGDTVNGQGDSGTGNQDQCNEEFGNETNCETPHGASRPSTCPSET